MATCQLCGRDKELTFHHLIPVCLHSNKWFKKNFTKEDMDKGIYICETDCHKEIHILISEKEMGKYYNTKSKLLDHPKVIKYINWIKNKG